ncbi:hypothetical protein WR25_23610 [Diploscapter pachys]|uniref:Uncharacterized protein n=1 Tax=Diploscapter pachys TaxID=2018661 RepID=A0A2A2L2T0_9BILA|nr:hypothetical protein WR25_23610 [Diploscapter pachys]
MMKREGKRGRIRKKEKLGKELKRELAFQPGKHLRRIDERVRKLRDDREFDFWESTWQKKLKRRLREHTRRTAMAQTEQIERESGKHVSGTGTLCFVCATFQPAICLTSLPSIHFPRSLGDLADCQLRDGNETKNDESGEVNKAKKGDETKMNENRWKLGSISNSVRRAISYGEIELAYS